MPTTKGNDVGRIAGKRVSGPGKGLKPPFANLYQYIAKYMVLPEQAILVIVAWVVATYLMDVWYRFPHLGITSAKMRSAKSRLLELLAEIVINAQLTPNITVAVLFRLIDRLEGNCTFLLDECQSIKRQGSENAAVLRELLNASISRKQKAMRCAGDDHDIEEYSLFCAKVFALIEPVDGILADRSLLIKTKRKLKQEHIERFRPRVVEQEGTELRKQIEEWTKRNRSKVAKLYDELEPFEIENDRMAELLLPLQAVLDAAGDKYGLSLLCEYAKVLDQAEDDSHDIKLLKACKDIFGDNEFIYTTDLLRELTNRPDEPWATFNRGEAITAVNLSDLLRPFGIQPVQKPQKVQGKVVNTRGYHAKAFADSWKRYLPT